MSFNTDLPSGVSADLSTVIKVFLDGEETADPATLGDVLESMEKSGLLDALIEMGRLEDGIKDELLQEARTLIEDHGADVLAIGFMKFRASENLATLIQSELDNPNRDIPPTLGTIRNAITSGRVAELVGTGDLDLDDDNTLITEVQNLIARHGENVSAEEFLP